MAKLPSIHAAASGSPALRQALQYIENWMTQMEDATGFAPSLPDTTKKRSMPPPLATFDVQGVDGHYAISITNAEGVGGTILHEIKAGSSVPISRASDVIVRGPAPDLSVDIIDPGSTRYFQLRSRYPFSDFNSAQVSQPISSGLLRSSSTSMVNTHLNPVGSGLILVQVDTNPIITVNDVSFEDGSNNTLDYVGGLVTVDDQGNPLGYDLYYIYADDPNKAGGRVTYKATEDPSVLTANDGRIFFGAISLTSVGGAIGVGGGSGPCPAAGSVITLFDGSTKLVELLTLRDRLTGIDAIGEKVVSIKAVHNVPSFTVTTNSGKVGTVSGDHLYQLAAGGFEKASSLNVNDRVATADGDEYITSKVYAGLKVVYRIALDRNKLFLADGIWSHNKSGSTPDQSVIDNLI